MTTVAKAKVENFNAIIDRASERKGGAEALASLVVQPASHELLSQLTSDRVLSQMSKSVFKSGFVWRVVEIKWPSFEEHFFDFNLEKILMMPDEMLERKATDPKIIRNLKKVFTIRDNAQLIKDIEIEHKIWYDHGIKLESVYVRSNDSIDHIRCFLDTCIALRTRTQTQWCILHV